MIGGLLIPSLALGLVGWVVPRLLARVFPEGMGPLLALALVAAMLMAAFASLLFLALYVLAGASLDLLDAEAWLHVLGLGTASALIWGPVLILSVAGLPARWTEAVW